MTDPPKVLPDPARERTLVIVAHPDDETIGLGSMLPRFGQATFAWVTDGSSRSGQDALAAGFSSAEHYGSERIFETECAFATAGIPRAKRKWLGFLDQEVAYSMRLLATRIRELIEEEHYECIVTHAYEGAHADHDATAFAVHAACRSLGDAAPRIVEMAGYHRGPDGIVTGEFLEGSEGVEIHLLSQDDACKKGSLLSCYRTQMGFLQNFSTDVERFRKAPPYDFTQPPHEGTLLYENSPWGMSGERFRELVRKASDALDSSAQQLPRV